MTARRVAAACLAATAAAAQAPAQPPAGDVAAQVRRLTGAHTRLAWAQGASRDANGSALVGLDSDDGRGVRVLAPHPTDCRHVHFAPDGEQVVFADFAAGKVRAVRWDGGEVRTLADGVPTDVWRDPCSGVQWVYAMPRWSVRDADMVFRFRLDRPDVIQVVWDKTPASWGWFSLSADGKQAVGTFPWPYCGTVTMPNGSIRYRGGGCWPSIAPDNSYRFWILGGAHQSIALFGPDGRSCNVVLRAEDGPVGAVSMLQWTNHARFLVLVSPLRGDWRTAEAYLGRFDAEFTGVDKWVRLTSNDVRDTYPDAWIQPGGGPREGVIMRRTAEFLAATNPAHRQTWPDAVRDTAFLWEDGSRPNRIVGADGLGPVCTAEPKGLAFLGRRWEMDLTAGGYFVAATPPRMLRRLQAAECFTLEALLTPPTAADANAPGAAGRVISYGPAGGAANFALLQRGPELLLELRTTAGQYVLPVGRVQAGVPAHVCVTFRPGELRCHVDGEPSPRAAPAKAHPPGGAAGSLALQPRGGLGEWKDGPLVFGAGWRGRLEAVAVTPRVFSTQENDARLAMLAERIAGRRIVERLVVVAALAATTPAPDPASIAPYRRALVANLYEVRKVLAGKYDGRRILVAQWAVLDGKPLPAAWRTGAVYRLELERFGDNPQLEAERYLMDVDALELPVYYCPARPPPLPRRSDGSRELQSR